MFALLSFLLLSAPPAAAWTDSFETIRQAASGLRSVQAHFTQKKMLKILSKPLVSEGRFAFAPPGSIRWEYDRPIRSVLLMGHGKLQRFSFIGGRFVPDSAERLEAMRVVIEEIKNWQAGAYQDSKTFSAKLSSGRPVTIELLPKEKSLSGFIQRIVLTLDEKPGVLKSVEIIERPQDSTLIEFSEVALDQPLPENLFAAPE